MLPRFGKGRARSTPTAPLIAISVAILGCSSAQFGSTRIDPALAALVPADTIMLSGVRMSEFRTTPLYVKAISQQRLSELQTLT